MLYISIRAHEQTRQHSSRMRTTYLPTVCVVVSQFGWGTHRSSEVPCLWGGYPTLLDIATPPDIPWTYLPTPWTYPTTPWTYQKQPGTRDTHRLMNRMTDSHLWKHNLPATSFETETPCFIVTTYLLDM